MVLPPFGTEVGNVLSHVWHISQNHLFPQHTSLAGCQRGDENRESGVLCHRIRILSYKDGRIIWLYFHVQIDVFLPAANLEGHDFNGSSYSLSRASEGSMKLRIMSELIFPSLDVGVFFLLTPQKVVAHPLLFFYYLV